jgi:hypothetical protein
LDWEVRQKNRRAEKLKAGSKKISRLSYVYCFHNYYLGNNLINPVFLDYKTAETVSRPEKIKIRNNPWF